MNNTEGMITLEEARRRLEAALADGRVPAEGGSLEACPTRGAVGRVLGEDQVSRLDLPPFDKAAMDGYAIPAGEEVERYTVVEIIAAGEVPRAGLDTPYGRDAGATGGGRGTSPRPTAGQREAGDGEGLRPGTAAKVMTGAPVPPGTDRVIMVEDAEQQGETVLIRRRRGGTYPALAALGHPSRSGRGQGTNICRRGEDVRVGEVVLRAGTVLTPLDVANLISCGIAEVPVVPRLRLAIISTGTEIVDKVEDLGPGKIMNANGPLLAALSQEYGLEVVSEESYGDEPEALRAGVETALQQADLVVLSGGVSAGDYDYVPQVLEELGCQIHFSRVAVKPGKPIVFATRGEKLIFGLPGNPVSVYVTFHLFVLRAVARLTGAAPPWREVRRRLGSGFRRRSGERLEYVPARLTDDGQVVPIEFHGSAHLLALARADGLVVVPAGVTELAEGEEVGFVSCAAAQTAHGDPR